MRNLQLTGRREAFAAASITAAARGISLISAEPSPLPVILGMGQPMLISIRQISSAYSSAIIFIMSATIWGSLPKSCTAQGRSASQAEMSARVLLPP